MSAPTKLEFDVEMKCGSCVEKIQTALANHQGIKSVDVNLMTGQVVVESNLGIDKVKNMIESTGRRAVLKGMGGSTGHLGAAVSIMEFGSEAVRGLVRLVQVEQDKLVIDGTIDGLTPGQHALCVHECGDMSQGCRSCGDIFRSSSPSQKAEGIIGDIEAGTNGRAEFRFISDRVKVWEIIGRSMIVHNAATNAIPKVNPAETRVSCGIVARSAGLFQNSKKICACDGVAQWDERNVPVAGGTRQTHTDMSAKDSTSSSSHQANL